MASILTTKAQTETKTETKKEEKPTRTPEETERLKREFHLAMNSYHVGSYKDAELDKMHNYVFQADGDYLIVNNKIGYFFVKMKEAEQERLGLPSEINGNKLKLKVPKIPKKIYYQILAFFRDIMGRMGNSEAFIQVYYDKQEEKYIPFVPEQTVSGASVRYDATKNLNEQDRSRYILVFEIHSHNTMGAFWSGTDNADEKDTRFYGVFGELNKEQHAELFRFMVKGKEVSVPKELIFDFEKEDTKITKDELETFINSMKEDMDVATAIRELKGMTTTYPAEWAEKVKTAPSTYKTQSHKGHGYIGGKSRKSFGGQGQNRFHDGGWDSPYDDDEDYDSWYKGNYGVQYEDRTTGYNSDTPDDYEEEDEGSEEIDIAETFDIGEYEEELHHDIIETFVGSLTGNDIEYMLECIVEQGHDGVMQTFCRR